MLTNTFEKEVQATLLPSHSKDIYLKKIHNSASTFGQPCFLSLLRYILTNDNLFLKYIQKVKFYPGADNFTQAVNGFAWKDLIQR